MSRGDNLRILDILDAASEVAAIVADGKDSFLTNSVSQRAVERLLEIMAKPPISFPMKSKVLFRRWTGGT